MWGAVAARWSFAAWPAASGRECLAAITCWSTGSKNVAWLARRQPLAAKVAQFVRDSQREAASITGWSNGSADSRLFEPELRRVADCQAWAKVERKAPPPRDQGRRQAMAVSRAVGVCVILGHSRRPKTAVDESPVIAVMLRLACRQKTMSRSTGSPQTGQMTSPNGCALSLRQELDAADSRQHELIVGSQSVALADLGTSSNRVSTFGLRIVYSRLPDQYVDRVARRQAARDGRSASGFFMERFCNSLLTSPRTAYCRSKSCIPRGKLR